MEPVRGHRSRAVVDAARLHRAKARKERRQTLIEGPTLLEEARDAGVRISQVFSLEGEDSPGSVAVDDRALQRLADTQSPRGPIAVIDIPDSQLPDTGDVLVSVGVSDPGNMGTLIRTAAAYGWSFGYMPGSADPWAPKVMRAAAGGHFQTAVVALHELPNTSLVAAVVSGGVQPEAISEPRLALLVGQEASGLPDRLIEESDIRVTIPTPGPTESLNVAVASGILVHVLSNRARNGAEGV